MQEIIRYIEKIDMPSEYIQRTQAYWIYKEKRYENTSGNVHLKNFISYLSVGRRRKKYNKKAMKYYNACYKNKIAIDYDWFMDKLYEHFKQFSDIKIKRDIDDPWYGTKSEYIMLDFKDGDTSEE